MEPININTQVLKGLINVNICGQVFSEICENPSFVYIGTMVIELHVFNQKKENNNNNNMDKCENYNLDKSVNLVKYLVHRLHSVL